MAPGSSSSHTDAARLLRQVPGRGRGEEAGGQGDCCPALLVTAVAGLPGRTERQTYTTTIALFLRKGPPKASWETDNTRITTLVSTCLVLLIFDPDLRHI